MRLYKSSKGQWVGTQRDAQRYFPRDWEQVEVPVSKEQLVEFLNEHKVGATKVDPVWQKVDLRPDPELIDPQAYTWVSWAYEELRRGNKKEAEAMLLKGLEKPKELQNETN